MRQKLDEGVLLQHLLQMSKLPSLTRTFAAALT